MRWLRPSNWIVSNADHNICCCCWPLIAIGKCEAKQKRYNGAHAKHAGRRNRMRYGYTASCALRPTTMNQKKKRKKAILVVRKRQWALLRYSRFPHYFINVLLAAMWNPHHNRSNEILMCVSCVTDVLFVYDLYFSFFFWFVVVRMQLFPHLLWFGMSRPPLECALFDNRSMLCRRAANAFGWTTSCLLFLTIITKA